MKEKQAIRVTLLLSFLVLVTSGKGIRYKRYGEDNTRVLPYRQVKKTIQMKGGDVYDCIDVNAQPSLNHPRLKNHKIQMQPSSFPFGLDMESQLPHSVSEVQPYIVDCPIGTIPIIRNNRSGNVEHNIDGVSSMDIQTEAAGMRYYDVVYGARAIINVYEPRVNKDSKDLSATWLQINNGGGEHTDRIGAGVEVNPSFSGDTFVRFHISWTDGLYKKSCLDHSCPGFVQVDHKSGLGARLQHVSVYGGRQYAMRLSIFKDPKSKNWWVAYGTKNTPFGYWPSTLFSFLNYKGDFVFWGGFVQGPTVSSNAPQMGSGHFASEGYGKAAYIRNAQILNENNKYVTPDGNVKVDHGTSNSTLYTVDKFEVDTPGMSIYYGGPGSVV
uniref:Uncharacterized protein n=1 Tax=Avena sativa TaxID=4498 RepID=A0ACD5ZAU6_AVESA